MRPSTPPNQCRQRGAAALFLLLLVGAVVAVAAYNSDGTRMTADAAQLKRAADAAAQAAALAYAGDEKADIQALAERYVHANLGMDAAQTGNQLRILASPIDADGEPGVRISLRFQANSMLAGAGPTELSVSSAAVARNRSLEVALALPNTLGEDAANLDVLRRQGKRFAEQLLANHANAWLSLVPYSQIVNVHDAADPGRLQRWARAGALNPVELTSLFRSGYTSLADRRIPDRRANLLCLYRGLDQGQNYFWDQAPSSQFLVHYRHDLPINGSPGAAPISWVGPNPEDFGEANAINDTRWMVADRGCPSAALLPLTQDLDAIGTRLDAMSTRFNTNYAIAMGWAAMALAPAFRGSAGWGLGDGLPRDFSDDSRGANVKAIVFLVNSSDKRWFDTDSYNAWVGQPISGTSATGVGNEEAVVRRRFATLCDTFRARKLRFFLIVTGNDEATDENGQVTSASAFRRIAGPGLERCLEQSSDQIYLSGFDFVASESRVQARLDAIVDELRQKTNAVRLIE